MSWLHRYIKYNTLDSISSKSLQLPLTDDEITDCCRNKKICYLIDIRVSGEGVVYFKNGIKQAQLEERQHTHGKYKNVHFFEEYRIIGKNGPSSVLKDVNKYNYFYFEHKYDAEQFLDLFKYELNNYYIQQIERHQKLIDNLKNI